MPGMTPDEAVVCLSEANMLHEKPAWFNGDDTAQTRVLEFPRDIHIMSMSALFVRSELGVSHTETYGPVDGQKKRPSTQPDGIGVLFFDVCQEAIAEFGQNGSSISQDHIDTAGASVLDRVYNQSLERKEIADDLFVLLHNRHESIMRRTEAHNSVESEAAI